MQWANHNQSLQLEEETKKKIVDRVEEKVASGSGTWIDWQYLTDAAQLLRKVNDNVNLQLISLLNIYCYCSVGTL